MYLLYGLLTSMLLVRDHTRFWPFSYRTHPQGHRYFVKEFLLVTLSASLCTWNCTNWIDDCLETFSQVILCSIYAGDKLPGISLPKSDPG